MKQFIFSVVAIITTLSLSAQNKKPYVLNGTVTDVKNGTVMIRALQNPKFDTVKIANGKFVYKGTLSEESTFVINDDQNRYKLFFMDAGKSTMTLQRNTMDIVDIKASPTNVGFKKLMDDQKPLQMQAQQLQQQFPQQGSNQDSLQKGMMELNMKLQSNFYSFLKNYKNNAGVAYIVYSTIANDRNVNAEVIGQLTADLSPAVMNSYYGKEITKMNSKLKAVSVGTLAPDFTMPDSNGKKYTLSGQRGHFTLIDFWASWCGPCKGEIPFMKTAYEKYHAKGFEIMSVSLDDSRAKWTAALQQFKMPWLQLSDCKGFSGGVNDLYHVPSIPKTLLLDEKGVIIATDLRGPALEAKLEELYK
jgi:peroxiredoxin